MKLNKIKSLRYYEQNDYNNNFVDDEKNDIQLIFNILIKDK